MQITLLTKSGSMGSIRPIRNRSGLGADDQCRIEVEGFSALSISSKQIIDRLFAHTDSNIYLIDANFPESRPDKILALPILEKDGGTLYAVDDVSNISKLFESKKKFPFGEFCIFCSPISESEVLREIRSLDRLDALCVLASKKLQVSSLVGLDVESDTGTVASVNENVIFGIISDGLPPGSA